ncbi:MAG TPA: regulatory protein RecX [Bryobacteraceae bacterium]|nr:regulatory protein RecX [Bryobacteraceae bacterium]
MKRQPKKLDLDGLIDYAGQSLSRRAQSISELRLRLKQRAARPEDVAEALARLKQAGLLNDRQFADSFAHGRRDNRGFGKARVMRDLMARRVAPAVAKQAADAAYAEVDEPALIESFLDRKYRGRNLGEMLAEPKRLASVYRRLRGAGFSASASIRVLKRFSQQADALEQMEEGNSG